MVVDQTGTSAWLLLVSRGDSSDPGSCLSRCKVSKEYDRIDCNNDGPCWAGSTLGPQPLVKVAPRPREGSADDDLARRHANALLGCRNRLEDQPRMEPGRLFKVSSAPRRAQCAGKGSRFGWVTVSVSMPKNGQCFSSSYVFREIDVERQKCLSRRLCAAGFDGASHQRHQFLAKPAQWRGERHCDDAIRERGP